MTSNAMTMTIENPCVIVGELRGAAGSTSYCGQVAAPSKLMIDCPGAVGISGRR